MRLQAATQKNHRHWTICLKDLDRERRISLWSAWFRQTGRKAAGTFGRTGRPPERSKKRCPKCHLTVKLIFMISRDVAESDFSYTGGTLWQKQAVRNSSPATGRRGFRSNTTWKPTAL